MTEQNDEQMPPLDFGPGGVFLTNGEEMHISIAGLSLEQSARVFALQQAREILKADPQTDHMELGGAHREWVKPGPPPEVMDVYGLAVFIIDGIDPWQEVRLQPTPLFRVASGPVEGDSAEVEGGSDEGLLPSD